MTLVNRSSVVYAREEAAASPLQGTDQKASAFTQGMHGPVSFPRHDATLPVRFAALARIMAWGSTARSSRFHPEEMSRLESCSPQWKPTHYARFGS